MPKLACMAYILAIEFAPSQSTHTRNRCYRIAYSCVNCCECGFITEWINFTSLWANTNVISYICELLYFGIH